MRRFFRRKKRWKIPFGEGSKLCSQRLYEQAEQKFREAVALAPKEPYPHYELAYTLFRMRRFGEALEELYETRRLSPGFFLVSTDIYVCESILEGSLSVELADIIRQIQQMIDMRRVNKSAMRALSQKIVKSAPDCPLGYYYLARTLEDPEDRRAALEKCLALKPDGATAVDASIKLGLLAEAQGDRERAMQIWRETVDTYKGSERTQICELIIQQRQSTIEEGSAP